ncbi:hypothetical protein BY458DRAFT_519251 [Sporodiniella umbellata]|nr:hypothetical protein BY458DRAFT_519251 [Sporodiniella umbellata]
MLKSLECLTVMFAQALLLTLGSRKLAKLLVRDYLPPKIFSTCNSSYIAHSLFSLTFSSSCTLLLLIFGEITQIFSNSLILICF